MKKFLPVLLLLASVDSSAALYSNTFSTTDGSSFTETNNGSFYGSDVQAGDSVTVAFEADTTDYWTVTNNSLLWTPVHILEEGIRTGSTTFNFLMKGIQVASIGSSSSISALFRLGEAITMGDTDFVNGLVFDRLEVVYLLDSSAPAGSNTITPALNDFSQTSFRNAVTYTDVRDMSTVPLPAAIWLFATSLAGFVGLSRRKAY